MSRDPAAGQAGAATSRPRPSDVLLAAVVVAVQLAATRAATSWHATAGTGTASAGLGEYLVLAAGGASLVVRRRYPVAVLAIALATTFWVNAAGRAGPIWLTLIVAFFNAVLAGRRAAAIGSLAIGYVASVWPPWQIGAQGGPSAGFALWLAAGLLVLLSAAELIRLRNQRAQALARGREEEVRRQASEERMRIARDLHDVVAHNISVINVQANTALYLMDRQPERARMALTTINDVSKQALVELRSALGVLRQVDEDEPRSPAPGLDGLDELVARAQAAGLTVRLELAGERLQLPANVDLAAYRIVQEALTNSAKHAAGSAVDIRIVYGGDDVIVQVEDEGAAWPAQAPTARPAVPPGGNGLAGMKERASALQGTLAAGPRPGGGFSVRARLPLNQVAPG